MKEETHHCHLQRTVIPNTQNARAKTGMHGETAAFVGTGELAAEAGVVREGAAAEIPASFFARFAEK